MFEADKTYDLVLVGTGFASSFFLHKYLQKFPTHQILVLEGGSLVSHQEQLKSFEAFEKIRAGTFVNKTPQKPWIHTPIFGGGSNCWWGCTPRFMPNDFKLNSTYGVGLDWPLEYAELEEYYCQAEELMAISGSDRCPYPRSRAYPQPAHVMTEPDKLLLKAQPEHIFHLPCARPRKATKNRPACCASGHCGLCPLDSKFTILNEMQEVFKNPQVTLLLNARCNSLDTQNNVAKAVNFSQGDKYFTARANLIALGANALFNPVILLRSGYTHPLIGKNLHEQMSITVILDLAGVDNFQGSTSFTAHGYQLYDGEHRKERAACLIETSNVPDIRLEFGKWRQRMQIKFIFEDLPNPASTVTLSENYLPQVTYAGHSEYAVKAKKYVLENLTAVLNGLPIEKVVGVINNDTESHILGTVRMGSSIQNGVTDSRLKLYQTSNVLVLGSSSFPVSGPANPTLTLSALSLRAADLL